MGEHKPVLSFSKKFQAGLLVLMIRDFDFLRLIEAELSVKYLDAGEAYLKLLKIIKAQYGINKKPLTVDIIRNILIKLQNSSTLSEPEVYGINSVIDLGLTLTHSEIEYVKSSAFDFFKKQVVARSVSESIGFLEKNDYDSIYETISSAYKKSFSVGESLGINYLTSPVIDRYSEPPRLGIWSSGFEKLDSYIEGGFAKSECYTVLSATGRGKCLGKSTKIITYDGTIKLVQDIVVGDKLMGPDGKSRNVLSTTKGQGDLYKIIPVKGDSYIVNDVHLLSLKLTPGSGNIHLYDGTEVKDGIKTPVFVEAKTLFNSNKTAKHCLKGWRPSAISFENEHTNHSIPPYILGMWLGDGTASKPSITQIPNEVSTEFAAYAASINCRLRESKSKSKASEFYLVDGNKGTANRFTDNLKLLGVLNKKHIPKSYKISSIQDRLELLAGLLDTDGSLHYEGYDFVQKDKQLAEDVVFIARSLGFAVNISECEKRIKTIGFVGKYWRVNISGDCSIIPCRIKYKQAQPRKQKKNHLLTGIKIEQADYGDYYGFEIDGDKQFLLGDWQVTHNTSLLTNFATAGLKAKKKVLFITLEMSEKQICHRMDSILSGFSAAEIASSGEIQNNLVKTLAGFTAAPYVKGFCRGSLTIPALRTYLDRFQNEVWKPDVVMLDWLGCLRMSGSSDKRHEQLAEAADELVNISREYEISLITAHQTNRSAVGTDTFNYSSVSESFASLFGLDAIFSLGSTEEAKDAGKRTLGILKNRMGLDGVSIKLQGDLPGHGLTFRFREAIDSDEESDLLSGDGK